MSGAGIPDPIGQRAQLRDARERGHRTRVCWACARPADIVLGWQASSVVPCGRCGKLPSDGTMVEEPVPPTRGDSGWSSDVAAGGAP